MLNDLTYWCFGWKFLEGCRRWFSRLCSDQSVSHVLCTSLHQVYPPDSGRWGGWGWSVCPHPPILPPSKPGEWGCSWSSLLVTPHSNDISYFCKDSSLTNHEAWSCVLIVNKKQEGWNRKRQLSTELSGTIGKATTIHKIARMLENVLICFINFFGGY